MAKINDAGFLEISGLHHSNYQELQLSSAKFPILEGLSPLNIRVLNQAAQTKHIAKDVEMIAAGDMPHDLYFIAQGSVTVTRKDAGQSSVVATLKAGDFFGEYGVLRGKNRFASVHTAEPSVMIRAGMKAIQQVLDADAEFKHKLLSVMKQRLEQTFLSTHVVFRGLSSAILDTLVSQLTVSELERGETLFSQGDAAAQYYMIVSGEAEVLIQQSKKTLLLDIRRDNDMLGEVRLDKKGSKYGYTVVATNQLDLLTLDKAAMQLLQQTEAKIVKRLQQFIIQQHKKTMAKIQSL